MLAPCFLEAFFPVFFGPFLETGALLAATLDGAAEPEAEAGALLIPLLYDDLLGPVDLFDPDFFETCPLAKIIIISHLQNIKRGYGIQVHHAEHAPGVTLPIELSRERTCLVILRSGVLGL